MNVCHDGSCKADHLLDQLAAAEHRAVEAEKRAGELSTDYETMADMLSAETERRVIAEAERDCLQVAVVEHGLSVADALATGRAIVAERDTLKGRVAGLRNALTVFAGEADRYDPDDGDSHHTAWATSFNIGDLRQARQALASAKGDSE